MNKSTIRIQLVLFLSFLLFSSGNLLAQNRLDANGKKTGSWKGSYKNGQLKYVGHFEADVPVDTFYYYYPDGKLKSRLVWKSLNESHAIMYYSTGEKMAEGKYLDQQKSGSWVTYGADEVKVNEGNYIGGKKYEIWRTYYPNGKVSEEVPFVANLENGSFKSYYENGSLQQEVTYVDGYRKGKTTIYYSDGNIKIKGQFVRDVRDGIWVYFKEDGTILKKIEFELGIRITPYSEDEKVEDLELFRENIKDDLEIEDMQGTIRYDKERK